MYPTLFELPWVHWPIRGYGMMLMVAFLGGTWWAARRALRVKCDPDLVVNLGFIALLASVVGARIFYVAHYWDRFAGRSLWHIVDLTAGGMEFYGGFIGAALAGLAFMLYKRVSVRLYLDIVAPSLMFGMGMARIGCFLNGCCWGAPCPDQLPWKVQFPYGSPAQIRQWEERTATLPAELIVVNSVGRAFTLSRELFRMSPEEVTAPLAERDRARTALRQAERDKADAATLDRLKRDYEAARRRVERHRELAGDLIDQARDFGLTVPQLMARVEQPAAHSRPVHPAQLYASMNGLALAALLAAVFHRRRRHGVVFALLLMLYPLCRVMEEIIRIDNPRDTAGLTISQFVSLLIFTTGLVMLLAIRRMPPRSPRATAWIPPELAQARPAAGVPKARRSS